MSTPLHPHNLRREQEKGAGGEYVAARYSQMKCDGVMGLCAVAPARAPKLMVPPKPYDIVLPWGQIYTTVHFCELHKGECTPELLLGQPGIKAALERFAKLKYPHGTVPDFDRARLKWTPVTTPEYRRYLERIETIGEELHAQSLRELFGVPIL